MRHPSDATRTPSEGDVPSPLQEDSQAQTGWCQFCVATPFLRIYPFFSWTKQIGGKKKDPERDSDPFPKPDG